MGSLLDSLDMSAVSSVQSGESSEESIFAGLSDLVKTIDHLGGVRSFSSQVLHGTVEARVILLLETVASVVALLSKYEDSLGPFIGFFTSAVEGYCVGSV